MGGINFGWLAVWVPSPDWRNATFVRCLSEAAAPVGGSAGHAPTLHRIAWHLPYNWGKSQKTSVRVTKWHLAVQHRMRFILSTWPSRAMGSTGLVSPAALGFCVRRRGQPSVSLSICRVAILGGSPHQLTLSQSSWSGLWCGRQTAEHPDPCVSACYLHTKGHQ